MGRLIGDRMALAAAVIFVLVAAGTAILFAWLVNTTLDLRDENDEINRVTRALVVDFADEVERSLATDCDLSNDRAAAIIRFWDRFVEFFTNPDTPAESLARAQAFRDQLVLDFPIEDCDQAPLIPSEDR